MSQGAKTESKHLLISRLLLKVSFMLPEAQ